MPSPNLLISLYRLAHRQQENFTTEAFAHLLRHLIAEERSEAVAFLDWLSDSDCIGGLAPEAEVSVRTQHVTEAFGIPDVRIAADDVEVIVEVKLGGLITEGQWRPYLNLLAGSAARHTRLVALVGSRYQTDLPAEIALRTWGEVGTRLVNALGRFRSDSSRYLAEQFVEFLAYLRLMPLRVRSRISEAVQAHLEWSAVNLDAPSITRGRIKSLSTLDDMPHLEPLRVLLQQMEHVLSHSPEVDRIFLDSSAARWIGFNVNGMRYFIFVWLDRPEIVQVQRYWGGVDPDSFDGTFGRLVTDGPPPYPRWSASLDLADPEVGYLERDEIEQTRLIAEFFERAFRYARRLRPHERGEAPGQDGEVAEL